MVGSRNAKGEREAHLEKWATSVDNRDPDNPNNG